MVISKIRSNFAKFSAWNSEGEILNAGYENIEKNYNRQEVVQELTLRATGAEKEDSLSIPKSRKPWQPRMPRPAVRHDGLRQASNRQQTKKNLIVYFALLLLDKKKKKR